MTGLDDATYRLAVGRLKRVRDHLHDSAELTRIVSSRAEVVDRFRPVFQAERLDPFNLEEFKAFLYLENNKHWSGLYRKGLDAAKDPQLLRQGLDILLDETEPIAVRYTTAVRMIPGMGKGLATAILTVAYPDRYGVWNNTSENGLRQLEIWPEFQHGDGPGGRYAKVNEVLQRLARDLEIDLWTLDALWWGLSDDDEKPLAQPLELAASEGVRFGLERHLHQFLLDNWDHTELAADWQIYEADGDPDAGYEYPCDVGRIDLLCKHRREARWLVIELKRNQSSDQTIGQVLRYIGWVSEHLAAPSDTIEGLVISHQADKAIRYALLPIPSVQLRLYEVAFSLLRPEDLAR